VATVSKKVLEECKSMIDVAVESVDEAKSTDTFRFEKLRARVKATRKAVKELSEELHGWRKDEVFLKGRINILSMERE